MSGPFAALGPTAVEAEGTGVVEVDGGMRFA